MSGSLRLAVSHEQSPLRLYGQQVWMRCKQLCLCHDMIEGSIMKHVQSITSKQVEMRSFWVLQPNCYMIE